MEKEEFILLFKNFGKLLRQYVDCSENLDFEEITHLRKGVLQAELENSWFSFDNINFCLSHWGSILNEENLRFWLDANSIKYGQKKKTILCICAGNIPMVGFFDILCVLASGNKALVKLSSKDRILIQTIFDILIKWNPEIGNFIAWDGGQDTPRFDAVIATGSNNTARYFEYNYRAYPKIIRKNRNSIAIIKGNESEEDLMNLGKDIFLYFGLGCRNVSKIYIPKNYDIQKLKFSFQENRYVLENQNYLNNYKYLKAKLELDEQKYFDGDYFLIIENESMASPLSCLHFEVYNSEKELMKKINNEISEIQCIINCSMKEGIAFGQSQKPKLNDWADGVNVLKFIASL